MSPPSSRAPVDHAWLCLLELAPLPSPPSLCYTLTDWPALESNGIALPENASVGDKEQLAVCCSGQPQKCLHMQVNGTMVTVLAPRLWHREPVGKQRGCTPDLCLLPDLRDTSPSL